MVQSARDANYVRDDESRIAYCLNVDKSSRRTERNEGEPARDEPGEEDGIDRNFAGG